MTTDYWHPASCDCSDCEWGPDDSDAICICDSNIGRSDEQCPRCD